ncbi:unnamed protein product [Adineta steineri]|uniref:Uncharacterized protein n=1 Tax=Adineta steineri TaxID=433720 RepID=A0A815LLD9_9BILA|nr:unnamed protein product [Adineta steineri]
MAKFLSRIFRSGSTSKSSSFHTSQTSLQDNQNRTPNNVRTSASLENLASYHIIPKELEKNKLHKASWEGNIDKVIKLARSGQVNIKDPQERTPLHLAVVRGHLDIVKYLIAHRAKLDAVDNDQRTPLIKAVLSGNQNPHLNYQICQALLNGGADDYINEVDKHGRNALHYAIDFGNENLVNLLLSSNKCDPNFKDRDQMTPLHLAIKRNSPHIVQLLVSDEREQQADPNIVNRYGQTPLHTAASVGYVDIVRLLLLSSVDEQCDPSILDSHQLTAYQVAKSNHQEVCAKLIEEYQERWYKQAPRRPTVSINDQTSMKRTNSVSLHPATNLQRDQDDTSDDSSTISTKTPSKSSPRRIKRSSDQWSDDNDQSKSELKPESHGLLNLFKANPLQSERTKTNESSVLNDLAANDPLRTDSKKLTSTSKPTTSQQAQLPSFFGIGPRIERVGSDNTSTSISVDQSVIPAQRTQENKPSTAKPYTTTVHHIVSTTKSWSDDTTTAPPPPLHTTKALPTIRQRSSDDTWNISQSDDDDDNSVPKVKSALSTLQKTLPFSPSINRSSHINSDDDDSIETEMRKFDSKKPTTNATTQNLVNKQIGNGYKVIGLSEVHSPVSEDSSWTASPAPINKETTTAKGVQNLVHHIDESSWTTSHAPVNKETAATTTKKGVQNLVHHVDESSWTTSHAPVNKETAATTKKGVQNLVQHVDESTWSISTAPIKKEIPPATTTTAKGVQNLVHHIDESSWTTTSHAPVNKETAATTTKKGVQNLVHHVDESSWTTSHAPANKETAVATTTTKGVQNLVRHIDESTWDDSRPLSPDAKQVKSSNTVSNLIIYPQKLPETRTTGTENLTKMMSTIMNSHTKQTTQPKLVGKLIVSSMVERTDSNLSENTSHLTDNEDDNEPSWQKKSEEWSVTAPNGQDFKTLQNLPRSTFPGDIHSLRESVSSTKSSINDLNELKENIKRLERNQEDTHELKRQLKEMEHKKNDFEKLYKENNQMLNDVKMKLELEKNEKQRLQSTTKDLNLELDQVRHKLHSLEDDKDLLNQRYMKLQEERDNHDKKLQMLQKNSVHSSSSNSYQDSDADTIRSLTAENKELHHRTKQLQSDVELHKESLDITKRYKIDLEKALEEKTYFQQELDRLKHEKDFVEHEKYEYKTKYDSLQEEIRVILFDRSKLEKSLTGELQEHIQEKQRSSDDIKKYRTEIEQLNIKLDDAEARLLVLQTQNEALLASKDRTIKHEYESLTERLNKTESDKNNAEQRYHDQHKHITNKQQQNSLGASLAAITSTPLNHGAHPQQSPTSTCSKCSTIQRNYEQEREHRMQTEKDNESLRDTLSRQKQYQQLNRTFPQEQTDENYLIVNSRQIRSDTERVKSELDRLRQDFDRLVANYEPTNNIHQQAQLHTQIDTFRQFYEQEFRQRQLTMSKITAGIKPAKVITYHRSTSSSMNHHHLSNETSSCTACINSRLLKERLETAIDTSLADQRYQTIKQTVPLPRQASALLTVNTTHNGLTSSVEILSPHRDV